VRSFYQPRIGDLIGGEDVPAVTAYKRHHFEHSPGRKLLAKDFGSEYTDTYLRDWHFGPTRFSETSV